jgi:hypothetical protein
MKDSTHTSDISDGELEPRMSRFLMQAWHLASNGRPHFMRISSVFKTGQPAAGCESHPRNILKIRLTHMKGEPMKTD